MDLRSARTVELDQIFEIVVDQKPLTAFAGESIAAALIAAGHATFRIDEKTGQPRGVFCGIGVCHECRVTVNGLPGVRACQTEARPGMVVATSPAATEPVK